MPESSPVTACDNGKSHIVATESQRKSLKRVGAEPWIDENGVGNVPPVDKTNNVCDGTDFATYTACKPLVFA